MQSEIDVEVIVTQEQTTSLLGRSYNYILEY
jgi:hypothetical protein